jgi:DNA topoisomerase IA
MWDREKPECKQKADRILGLSMSRCCSIKYGARIDVGRVMSPTLFFVVKRYIDVQAFKPSDYYQIKTVLVEGFTVFLKSFEGLPQVGFGDLDAEKRLVTKSVADRKVLSYLRRPERKPLIRDGNGRRKCCLEKIKNKTLKKMPTHRSFPPSKAAKRFRPQT